MFGGLNLEYPVDFVLVYIFFLSCQFYDFSFNAFAGPVLQTFTVNAKKFIKPLGEKITTITYKDFRYVLTILIPVYFYISILLF